MDANSSSADDMTSIFIRSYPKDFSWLSYCLRSIKQFTSGFHDTIIVVPADGELPELLDSELVYALKSPAENSCDYLWQQNCKLYADTFTDADWILHTDSDTIFTRPVTPETYLKNGKFVWMMTPMGEAHPNEASAWRKVMHKFMGKKPEFEFMRRHPFLLPRWLYGELRAFCLKQHGVELKDYVMSQPYREFSEFNVLGFYAYEFHRDKFEWFDTSKHPENEWPVLTVDQCWSHNPIPTEKWDNILSDGYGDIRKSVPETTRLSTTDPSPNPVRQTTLSDGDNNTAEQETRKAPAAPSLNTLSMQDHVRALSDYASKDGFAKMRVYKELIQVGLREPKKKK
jgi:hypothetical protein